MGWSPSSPHYRYVVQSIDDTIVSTTCQLEIPLTIYAADIDGDADYELVVQVRSSMPDPLYPLFFH
jgi:hypothetical protein